MADENGNFPNGTFVFTSAAIRYVAPSFSRLQINHLMGMVSGQLCALNHEAQPNDALLELHGVYVYEINELYRKMGQLCQYMEKFGIPAIQFCIPGEDKACTDNDVEFDL